MMKTRVYILLGMLGLSFTACNDFLNVEQKGKVIPKTVEDYDLMLNDPVNASFTNVKYMSPESVTSFDYSPISGTDLRAYTWSDFQYLAGENDNNWNNNYGRIAVCNEIINHIDEARNLSGNENVRAEVKGQAYADRAKCYFALINLYGAPYSKADRNKEGVPMLLENDITQQKARATVGEIYDLICEDLRKATNMVPLSVSPMQKRKACRQGVLAFKAKVFLFMNEVDSAYAAINKAFEVSSPELSYVNEVDDNIEIMAYDNPEVIWLGAISSNSRSSQFYYTDELTRLYDPDNDNRFLYHARMIDPVYGEEYPMLRYLANTERTFAASAPEMYLLRAECLARKGMYTEAMEDLTTLRASRYVEGAGEEVYKLTATSKEDGILKVKEERLRELAFTGQHWLDLRRYQSYGEPIPTFSREVNRQTYTLEPGSKRYTCAIPRIIIAKNPNLTQNPR